MPVEELREEVAFFEEQRPALVKKCPGLFALVKKRTLIGVFPTQEEAYNEGFRQFGREPFLVKQILEKEGTEQVPLLASRLLLADL
jgi:hypothetical protein